MPSATSPNQQTRSRTDYRGPKRGDREHVDAVQAHQPQVYPNTATFAPSTIPGHNERKSKNNPKRSFNNSSAPVSGHGFASFKRP